MPAARSKAAALALATGSVIGTVVMRRHRRKQQVRVDLYFADGSMVALPGDEPDAAPILAAARDVLRAAP